MVNRETDGQTELQYKYRCISVLMHDKNLVNFIYLKNSIIKLKFMKFRLIYLSVVVTLLLLLIKFLIMSQKMQ